ncbi:MAG: glycoside hydrolase family 172 protein [Pirellulaceae bacterium]
MRRVLGLCWIGFLVLGSQVNAQTVNFASLLEEIVNRDNLARIPVPAYTCSQASSYDRGSVAPDKPGWFANADRSQFVRVEEKDGRKEFVLMDEEGPGAVVRFWATWHGPGGGPFSNGTLRFYLDNNPQPVIEGPAASIIDGGALCQGPLSEGVSPQTPPAQRGHNLYLPIPYAKHCKVTYETNVLVDIGAPHGEALYYQINYRTYAAGTNVESFAMDQLGQHKEKLAAVQQRLLKSGADASKTSKEISFAGPLAAETTRALVIDNPGAIRQISVNLQADNLPQTLRSTILTIEFDGKPAVWCPVEAFFGRGYQSQPHQTWYTEVTADGRMSCYWVMPFAKTCRISLMNLSEKPVEVVEGRAVVSPWKWDDRSMTFHATWRQLTKVSSFREGTTKPEEGAFDVNFVEITGQGVYVGDTLTVFNGADAWWGEGDEKIFVDGEAFPSHIGTGSEDYFGYAWCRPEFFASPFHAQPSGAGNLTAGFSVNSRYRALDAIPFTKSLKFDMELWHWANTVVNYAPATFWYARPDATQNVAPDPETAAKPVALKRSDVVETLHVQGALEGEDLKTLEMTGGTLEKQTGAHFRWSGDTQLWWRDAAEGARLVLEFPVEKAGRYEVVANLTKAIDYGIVKVSLNDGEPKQFDRFNDGVANDSLVLGLFELPQGPNRLTVEIAGANEKAVKSHMFGLDYLQLNPQP